MHIGKTTVGLSDFVVSSSIDAYLSGPYVVPQDGTINTISIYSESVGVSVRLGIYYQDDVVTKYPTTLIASTDFSLITTSGWQTLPITSGSGIVQKNKRYWIVFLGSASITYKMNITEEKWWYGVGTNSGSPRTFRNPFTLGGGSTLYREISAYFTYTPTQPVVGDNFIQDMIDNAEDGSTIYIPYGFYNVPTLKINKSIRLVGISSSGRKPVIQAGIPISGWLQSTDPSHTNKNVWYKDISISDSGTIVPSGKAPSWVRSLQLDDKSLQILQYNPFKAGEGANESQATTERNYLLTCEWSYANPAHFLVAGQTIDFWKWYDAIACCQKINSYTNRIWLRLNNNNPENLITNPNNHTCYGTFTMNTRSSENEDWNYSNDLSTIIRAENVNGLGIRNLEIRGGRWGIDVRNSKNISIEKNKLIVPSLRSINITDCSGILIRHNESTSNRIRKNIHPGFGGTSDRSKAAQFGWSLNKNYSTNGAPSPAGHSVELTGVTSNVNIRYNWFHGNAGGISWGYGLDNHSIDADIEYNIFENMDSNGIVIYGKANGVVQYNIFNEVHLNFRIQDQMNIDIPTNLITIKNNLFESFESAGYLLQAHYSGVRYRVNFINGSGTTPVANNSVRFTGGTWNNYDRTIIYTSGNNVTGSLTWYQSSSHADVSASWTRSGTTATVTKTDHGLINGDIINITSTGSSAAIPLGNYSVTVSSSSVFTITCLNAGLTSSTLQYFPFTRSVSNLSTGWTANVSSIQKLYEWTLPVVFNDNIVKNVPHYIANLLGYANVKMNNNLLDSTGGITSELITYGLSEFNNNWVGGDVGSANIQPWWGVGNSYILNRRLNNLSFPTNFREAVRYFANLRLPRNYLPNIVRFIRVMTVRDIWKAQRVANSVTKTYSSYIEM